MGLGGPPSCAHLAFANPGGDGQCAPDNLFGKHCKKSCGTLPCKMGLGPKGILFI